MSSIRNPQQKKRLAYDRDHYAKSEYDKARNAWRIKKLKARQSYRRAVDSLARAAALDGESDSKISAIRQRAVRRWPVPSLREDVAHKLKQRVRSVGAKRSRRAARQHFDQSPHPAIPRLKADFCVASVGGTLSRVRRRTKAGFSDVSRQAVIRRFWQYLRFLQSHRLTLRTIARSLADVGDTTELRNSDLTDAGFGFVRYSHWRWVRRLYQDAGAKKEDAYLKKWYEKFQSIT